MRIQAKQNIAIPPTLCARVKKMLSKRRITKKTVNPEYVKETLKLLRETKYYNHAHAVQLATFNKAPPQMTDKQEKTIMLVFDDVIEVYKKLKSDGATKGRHNMLSYNYLLWKILEVLGYKKFKNQLSMIKQSDRLEGQEALWKMICSRVDSLHYIPSQI